MVGAQGHRLSRLLFQYKYILSYFGIRHSIAIYGLYLTIEHIDYQFVLQYSQEIVG